jgi:hypothetical protein
MRYFLIFLFVLLGTTLKAQRKNHKDFEVTSVDTSTTLTVPVIFHVFSNPKRNVTITNSSILGLLETLRKDFLNLNRDLSLVPSDFSKDIGNPKINFVLATHLPNGSSTTGIIRRTTKRKNFTKFDNEPFDKSPIVNSKSYLNVYICDIVKGTNAYTLDRHYPERDGVVIDYKRVFEGSRTLTHEVGHWLALYHTHEKDYENGDYVLDTPEQEQGNGLICRNHPIIEHDLKIMFMNFMGYSKCRYFFTKGQVERMRKYIKKYKDF